MIDLRSSGKETLRLLPRMVSVASPQTWQKALLRPDFDSFYCSITNCLYPCLKTCIWKHSLLSAWISSLACLLSWILGWEYTTVSMVSLLHEVGIKYSLGRAYRFISQQESKRSCYYMQVILRTAWQETKQIRQLQYIVFLRSLNLWWLKKNKKCPPKQINHSAFRVWSKAFSWSDSPTEATQSFYLKSDLAIFGVTYNLKKSKRFIAWSLN